MLFFRWYPTLNYPSDLFYLNEALVSLLSQVSAIAKQFALLHNALKFEALRLLSTILSSSYSVWNSIYFLENFIFCIIVRCTFLSYLSRIFH